jgi:integrase
MTTPEKLSERSDSLEIIDRFKDFCRRRSSRAMSDLTLRRYAEIIDMLSRYHALPLESVDLDELTRVVTERAQRIGEKRLSPATFNTELATLRRWVEFHSHDPTERQFRAVLRFKALRDDDLRQSRRLKDSDVLQPSDVEDIISHFRDLAWKALVAVLWDTGCRIGEIVSLDYADVTRDEHGFILHIRQSKTKRRSIRLITPDIGLKYFQPYYLAHSGRSALFQMRRNGRIEASAVRKELYLLGKRIDKKIWPTVFRKSASTHWKKSGLLPDPAIRQRLGHSKSSRIFEQWYLQYGDDSQKNAELKALGIIKDVEVRVQLRKCWRCGTDVPTTEDHCMNCHASASGRTLQEDVREKGELEKLKFDLANIETELAVLVKALGENPKLRKIVKELGSRGVDGFIELLE